MTPHIAAQVTAEVTAQVVAFCPAKAIIAELVLKHCSTFQMNYLRPLMAMGILERIIPYSPRSRMRRYRTATAGPAMAIGHASGRPPVSESLAPDSGRKAVPSRTKKGKSQQ